MATWSASSGYMSVGIDLSYEGDPNRGWVNVHAIVYARSDGYGHSYSSTWSWWGDCGSGSEGFSFSSGYGATVTKVISDWRFSVWTAYGQAKWVKVGASLGPIWNGGNPSVEAWIQIPARQYQAPGAPTAVTAVRQSERQVLVSWTLPGASIEAPVQQIGVQRRSVGDPQWKQMVWLANASATSWTDTAVPGNDRVEYRVQTWNSGGYSAHADASSAVTSSVAAPSGVTAAKDSSGSIIVSWLANYPGGGVFEVFDNGVKVGESPVVSGVAPSFTHVGPDPQVTHTYTVKQIDGGVSSPLSAPSPTVQLLAQPNPPQLLRPSGTVQSGDVVFGWRHNPVDSTPQSKGEMRWRLRGSATWMTQETGESSQVTLALAAGEYEWQARTKGLHSEVSAWSSVGVVTVADSPGAVIVSPPEGETVLSSILSLEWSFYQAQGASQAAAEVELLDEDGHAIEKISISGSGKTAALSWKLADKSRYTVRVRVMSSHGIWSEWAAVQFSTDFPLPPAPRVTVEWAESRGTAIISIVNVAPEQESPATPAAVSNTVERSVDGGESWEIVAEKVGISSTLVDGESLSSGTTAYRVTAMTDLPSSVSVLVELHATSDAMWISGGRGFSTAVPLNWDPQHSTAVGLVNRKVHYFAGRRLGVEMSGTQSKRSVSVSATLLDERLDLIRRLEELSYLPAPFLYRDPLGRRIYGSLSGVQMDRAVGGKWQVSAVLEEVERR